MSFRAIQSRHSVFMGSPAPRGAQDKITWAQEDIKATDADVGAAADFASAGKNVFGKR